MKYLAQCRGVPLLFAVLLVISCGGGHHKHDDDSDLTPPTISLTSPAANALFGGTIIISADAQDDIGVAAVEFYIDGALLSSDSSAPYSTDWDTLSTSDGNHSIEAVASDAAGNNASSSISVTVDNTAPAVSFTAPTDGATVSGTIDLQVNASDTNGIDRIEFSVDGSYVDQDDSSPYSISVDTTTLSNSSHSLSVIAYDNAGLDASQQISITVDNGLPQPPPDPATRAPTPDPTVVSSIDRDIAFLYSGNDPIQTGVADDTIQPQQVAVIRGQVNDENNDPLPSVTITIKGHPELGQTVSRVDGMFDMAVNGGGVLTLNYVRQGYLTVQRTIDVPWRDYIPAPDVIMKPLDSQVTTVTMGSGSLQSARGSVVSDDDGSRQATLLIPANTSAELVMPDGSRQAVGSLNVRATEYTVGENGPLAMPGVLPPTSGYTYAVELSADEALAAGASEVAFSQPISLYVEDFIGFPVGTAVPTGFYDREQAQWKASQNGRVIKILAINNNLAELDTDGDDLIDNAATLALLDITEAERSRLASLYNVDQQLWRVPIQHFSTPDCNWFQRPVDDTEDPDPDLLEDALKDALDLSGKKDDDSCDQGGYSTLHCQKQSLSETLAVTGTPFTLNYSSSRVEGYRGNSYFPIRLVGDILPDFLAAIRVHVSIAGRVYEAEFENPLPNQEYLVEWDGLNSYGQQVFGTIPISITLEYGYPSNYYAYESSFEDGFARVEGVDLELPPAAPARTLFWRYTSVWAKISRSNTLGHAGHLGRWSLDVHHAYDPNANMLYLGTGGRLGSGGGSLDRVIQTISSPGLLGSSFQRSTEPVGIVSAADGSIYVADTGWHHIWRITPDGTAELFAGTPNSGGYSGDGGLARGAKLSIPMGLAIGPDGSVYIADSGNHVIRRVTPDGFIETVAGDGSAGYSGDGGPAIGAQLNNPVDVAVSNHGDLFIADRYNNRVRWVGPDGIITTLAGTGDAGFSGDDGAAKDAWLDSPTGLDVAGNGSVYIADYGNRRVRKVSREGIISTAAGNGLSGADGDGGLAIDASLTPWDIALNNGALFVTTTANIIRRVGPDGFISTEAGGADCFSLTGCYSGDGGPGSAASLNRPKGIDVRPNGALIFVDSWNYVVRSLQATLPGFSTEDITVTSGDGNLLYHFLPNGRHIRTLNTRTGALVYEFGYDNADRLASVTDVYGRITTIERDGSGLPVAIIGPYGQRTDFTLDANGALDSIENPAGDTYQFQYTADGLLTQKIDPAGFTFDYTYGAQGQLVQADAEDGSQHRLARTVIHSGDEVTVSTALDHDTVYRSEKLPQGGTQFTTTYPTGLQLLAANNPDGSQTQTAPDGTVTELLMAPDPRWGMQAPLISQQSVRTPGNVENIEEMTREVTYSLPGDPLSMATQTDTFVNNGRTSTFSQDIAAGEITVETPELRQAVYQLDDNNRLLSYQRSGLAEIRASYDDEGRPRTITLGADGDPNTRSYGFAYDAEGNLSSYTDPLLRDYSLIYDDVGLLTSITTPDNRTIGYGYNARGELTSLTPPGKLTHFLAYTVGKKQNLYDPPGLDNDTAFSYDTERKLTEINQQGVAAVGYGFDANGRFETLALARGDIDNTYHATTGKLDTVTTPDGNSVGYTWDGFLLTRMEWNGDIEGSVDFGYNTDFDIASIAVNSSNTMAYSYDDDKLLIGVGSLQLTRDAVSGFVTASSLGDVDTAVDRNQFGEIVAESASYNASSLFSASYTYDSLGRVLSKSETIEGSTSNYVYTYDAADRLSTVTLNGTGIASYSYDSNGNRTSQTINSVTSSATFDAQDRLLTSGATSYTYTDNGELLTKTSGSDVTTYDYDAIGNLMSVTLPDTSVIDYLVDGRNRRVGKQVDGSLVSGFLYQDSLKPVAQLDASNNVVSRFVYTHRSNVPAYMQRAGNTYRIITDRFGSVRLVVNEADGTIAQRIDYDAFGIVLNDTNPGFQPFGFAGGLYDSDTGLVRFGVRDYDSATGRWTSKDPILFAGGDTNLYRYSNGDPLNYRDPQGLFFSPYKFWCALWKIAREQQRRRDQCKAGVYSRWCKVKWDPTDPHKDGPDPREAFEWMEKGADAAENGIEILGEFGIDVESPIPLDWFFGAWGAGVDAGQQGVEYFDNAHSGWQDPDTDVPAEGP